MTARACFEIGALGVWLTVGMAASPAACAGPAKAEAPAAAAPGKTEPAAPARAEPAAATKDLAEAVGLITSRPRLEALRPDNVRQELAKLVAGTETKWRTTKSPASWIEEAVAGGGAVEKVTVDFGPVFQKAGQWQLQEILIEVRGYSAAQMKDLVGQVQQLLGKPLNARPKGKSKDTAWSLKDDWTAHVAVQPLRKGKPQNLLLFASSVAADEGED